MQVAPESGTAMYMILYMQSFKAEQTGHRALMKSVTYVGSNSFQIRPTPRPARRFIVQRTATNHVGTHAN